MDHANIQQSGKIMRKVLREQAKEELKASPRARL